MGLLAEQAAPSWVPVVAFAVPGDPSEYSIEALLKALAVRPEDHGPTPDAMPMTRAGPARCSA